VCDALGGGRGVAEEIRVAADRWFARRIAQLPLNAIKDDIDENGRWRR